MNDPSATIVSFDRSTGPGFRVEGFGGRILRTLPADGNDCLGSRLWALKLL